MCGNFTTPNGDMSDFPWDVLSGSDSTVLYGDRCCREWKVNTTSIYPSTWLLCNYPAKHGTNRAHRLVELPSAAQHHAPLLDMIINAAEPVCWWSQIIIDCSRWNFYTRAYQKYPDTANLNITQQPPNLRPQNLGILEAYTRGMYSTRNDKIWYGRWGERG